MARRTVEGSSTGSKLLAWLAVAALIYWAGRDPHGAAVVANYIGKGIAGFVHSAAQHANKQQ